MRFDELTSSIRNQVLVGNALEVLQGIPESCIQTTVTSPPYYGLRDYGHDTSTWPDGWVGCLGAEPSVEAFVDHLGAILGEVHRVTRPDGSLWLNLGDTYQDKRLLGVPWRVALALESKGWILRSEVIWHKLSAMPENVSDRPTRNHEHLFLFSKSASYYYDQEAVRASTEGNLRTVWSINPSFYQGAHSAVFPPALPRRCIQATSPSGGVCGACGAPYERRLERVRRSAERADHPARYGDVGDRSSKGFSMPSLTPPKVVDHGFHPSCVCPPGAPLPGLVLDPFAGSGTTASEATQLLHDFVAIDVNPANAQQMRERLASAQDYRGQRELFEMLDDLK